MTATVSQALNHGGEEEEVGEVRRDERSRLVEATRVTIVKQEEAERFV